MIPQERRQPLVEGPLVIPEEVAIIDGPGLEERLQEIRGRLRDRLGGLAPRGLGLLDVGLEFLDHVLGGLGRRCRQLLGHLDQGRDARSVGQFRGQAP